MTPRDGFPRFSARSVRCGDAVYREAYATLSESLSAGPPIGKPPCRSRMRPVGGRRNGLTMHRSTAPSLLPDGPPTRSLGVIISVLWYDALAPVHWRRIIPFR